MREKDIVQTVTIKHQAVGTEATKAAVNSVTDAVKGLGDATQATGAKQENAARRQASAAAAFEQLERRVNPAARALADLERAQRLVGRAVDQNAALQDRGNAILQVYRDRVAAAGAANGELGKGAGLARHELINLSRQVQDVGVSLASGQSPMTVLVQQGTQIADVFASSGASVRGFFSQAMGWAGRFVTSTAGVATGVAAMGAAFVAAGTQFAAGQREIEKALSGIGAASGLTRGGVNKIAEGAASPFGLSVSEARSAVSAFAATGKIYGENINQATQLTKQFALAMDIGVGEAAKKLAADLQDPVRAAMEWNKTLGFLDAGTLNHIRSLDAMGKKQEAMRALMDATGPSIAKQAQQVGMLTNAWNAATNFLSDYFQRAGAAYARTAERLTGADLGGFSDEERLQRARDTQSSLRSVDTTGLDAQSIEAYADAVRSANEEVTRLEKKLEDVSKAARLKDLSIDVDAFSRSINASLEQVDRLSKGVMQINQLREARANVAQGLTVEEEGAAQRARALLTIEREQAAVEQRKVQIFSDNAARYGHVSAMAAQTLAHLQAQLPIAQALTGAAQMKAQYEATYTALLAQGASAIDAQAIAAAQYQQAQAQATTSVMQQVQALKDQNQMIVARANGTEAATAAAIAYRTAMDSGASETAAAALEAETLKNQLLQAAVAASSIKIGGGLDWSAFDAYTAAGGHRPDTVASGDFGFNSNSNPDVMTQKGQFSQNPLAGDFAFWESVPTNDLPKIIWGEEVISKLQKLVDGALTMQNAQAQFLAGSSNKQEKIAGLGMQMQSLFATLGAHPENIWQIQSLQQSIQELMNSVDENTAALNKVTLNPLYTEGRSALKVGYMGAASGLDMMVRGGIPGVDSVPINIMAQQGERVQVHPVGNASNDNRVVTTTSVINNMYFGGPQSTSRRSERQLSQRYGQMLASLS